MSLTSSSGTLTPSLALPSSELQNTNSLASAEELCGECKPKTYPPWENMIKRTPKHTFA